MQKWIYYDYMDNQNPVCEDAGKIEKIIPDFPEELNQYYGLRAIVADGIYFPCDIKPAVIIGCRWVPFSPYFNDDKEQETQDLR